MRFAGLYFAFVTTSGIGFGDVVPLSRTGQLAVAVYIIYSAGVTAAAVSLARDVVVGATCDRRKQRSA